MTRVLEAADLEFDYDEEGDVLYISVGGLGSQPAVDLRD
jgi:hypothetical protein